MSSTALRAMVLAATGSLGLAAAPAAAQVDQRIAANILIECSKIGDSGARLACYDNNVRNLDPSAPLPPPIARPGGAAPVPQGPGGFGLQQPRAGQPAVAMAPQADEINPRVLSAQEREPGKYLVTLEDGAQWMFADGVPISFRPPQRGDTVKIERASMGGFLMRVGQQQSVPVRRVR